MAVACAQSKGYSGRSDTVWTLLNGLRTPAVHDWLNRFSAFCQKNAAERQLENAEMLCLIRLGKGLELMNLLDKPEEVSAQPPPRRRAVLCQVLCQLLLRKCLGSSVSRTTVQ